MSLSDWLANRWIVTHVTSRNEIADLLAVVQRDLDDAQVPRLSDVWRLGITYNAALQLATLVLAAEGYRPSRERAHERAILSLRFTIGADAGSVDVLDRVRRKRNQNNRIQRSIRYRHCRCSRQPTTARCVSAHAGTDAPSSAKALVGEDQPDPHAFRRTPWQTHGHGVT